MGIVTSTGNTSVTSTGNDLVTSTGPQNAEDARLSKLSESLKQKAIFKTKASDIFSLKKRYPDQHLIDDAFKAIASTRKSGKVADSILLSQLEKWERYPVEQVEAGIQTYLDKGYASEGKCENYLLGIIRKSNSQPKNNRGGQDQNSGPPEPVYPEWKRGNF